MADEYLQTNFDYRRAEPPLTTSGLSAPNSFQDAHSLLAVYPMTSVTPSTHVARHLSNLAISGTPPSSIHAGASFPYSDYANETAYLSSVKSPAYHSEYWENTRSNVLGVLRDQGGSPDFQHRSPSLLPTSSYRTDAFAQSVIQGTHPSSSYPTPPGIAASSSSLALALGTSTPRFTERVYEPGQSKSFFDGFLEQTGREKLTHACQRLNHESPPESLPHHNPDTNPPKSAPFRSLAPTQTPTKRKPDRQIESPTVKRVQSTRQPNTPLLASGDQTTSTVTSPIRRTVTLAYVEIPPSPWLTPSSNRKWDGPESHTLLDRKQAKAEFDDLGDYASDYSPVRNTDVLKSSSRRTGDRDERAPLEKLVALFEDIFEAEDTLLPDSNRHDLPSEFFSSAVDDGHPLLHPAVIRKLTKYIGQVARPTKRIKSFVHDNTPGSVGSPRGKGRIATIDAAALSRMFKILERSVKAGEDLDPFTTAAVHGKKVTTARKSGALKRWSNQEQNCMSQSQKGTECDAGVVGEYPATPELSDVDLGNLAETLDMARDSILAADCCIALLGSDGLTKQLYSEELISACFGTIKNQLTKVVYPFVEASADASTHANHLLQHLIKSTPSASQDHRRQLHEIFQALSAILPRVNNLVCAENVAMSDSIIIQAVYIAIGPFFIVEPGANCDWSGKKDNIILNTLGKSAMRGLRLDALSLIRNIFAHHEDQRSWIIEEILMSLIKLSDTKQKAGQFRLRDGRSIKTVSALLLQLVQTSAHDVRMEAQSISKARQQHFALHRQESTQEKDIASQPFLNEYDMQEIRLYSTGLESATKAAKTIVLFLTQRSGKGKAVKNSNEADYRIIFDNLISDLLVVLYWPEWPAASLLLSIACKFMVSSLDDVKSTNTIDNHTAKAIALDHLGVIAARIQSITLKIEQNQGHQNDRGLRTMDEILSSANSKDLERLLWTHRDVSSHLCKRSSEDQAYDSARELQAAILGQELAAALKQVNALVSDTPQNFEREELRLLGLQMKTALQDIWKEPAADVFNIGSPEDVARIDRSAEKIGATQGLKSSFHPILNIILLSLDAPPVSMRTKALRALGQIIMSDSKILSELNVRHAIESHLLDSSAAVRDAAVELIGKYMIDSPEVAGDYYHKIADRMADTGVGVRKRVIKLLKSFYYITDDTSRLVDISTRMILRMLDEDDGVQELAARTMEELWFKNAPPILTQTTKAPGLSTSRDNGVLAKVAVIMGVSANFKDRQSPFEILLRHIMANGEKGETPLLHARYAEICEVLIDGLVDASDLPGFTVINCIRTIYVFTSAYPSILSGSSAAILLPYLKNATTIEEQATSDYLLKIFRASLPHMPRTAVKFGQELQSAIQPMIVKPSTIGGVLALQETVACLCAVVQNLTHDFARLVALAKSCNDRVQVAIKQTTAEAMTSNEIRALSILVFIISLLGAHCNFDQLRHDNPAVAADLNLISQGSIIEHIYNSLLKLYEKFHNAGVRGRILQCLGFLFRAQPTLMTLERSAIIMDDIFASHEDDSRGRLLKIIQEFLLSEAATHSAGGKENAKSKLKHANVDMEELIGNTDEFANSGVSSAVVQRYLDAILQAVLSQNPQIQATAIDILSFTIKLGLAHPLQSFPVIVALGTSPSTTLRARASALHTILHNKHTSLVNTRYTISARASFEYQKTLVPGRVQGFRMAPLPTALLQTWYSLVREKRAPRQDFLKALVKVFDMDTTFESSQNDIDFARYMAENFSALEYKTQEEVLTVVKYLTSVLSTTGMQLVETLSPWNLRTQLGTHPGPNMTDNARGSCPNKELNMPLVMSSVIIGIVMLLRTYLKSLYGITEDKCSKYIPGKKTASGDKPANRRHEEPISWSRLPFATTPLLSTNEMDIQKTAFLNIWDEDGLLTGPEDNTL